MAKTAKKVSAKTAKATKKTAKKTAKTSARRKMTGEGYKGHRPGTLKEKLHKLFDTLGDTDKARAAAMKLPDIAPATVNTSFSQFRTGKFSGKAA